MENGLSESKKHRDVGSTGQLSLFGPEPEEENRPVATALAPAERAVRSPQSRRSSVPRSEPLSRRLSASLSTPVRSLTLTRNRTRIISAKPHRSSEGQPVGLDIRVHRCFAEADDRVVRAVVDFLEARNATSRKRGLAVIREHFRLHGQEDTRRPPNLKPKGRVFDLSLLRDRVNQRYFGGSLRVDITWSKGSQGGKGRARSKGRRRRKGSFSIRLGSYDERLCLVRIHPVLDRPDVPEMVVESIVYHEMLHAVIPPKQGAQRRSVHPPEFRRLERQYEHYEEAEAWLDANVERLARLR